MKAYGIFGVFKGAAATMANFSLFLLLFIIPAEAEGSSYEIGTCGRPSLSLTTTRAYWATFPDFQQRQLSIDYSITNAGGPDAMGLAILGTNNTNGVILSSPTPVEIGNIYQGSATPLTLRFSVPGSTSSFKTVAFASAGDYCDETYNFPGPYPGEVDKPSEFWIRPPQSYLDADGLHLYSATTNRFANPQLADTDSDGVADGWNTWTPPGAYATSYSVEPGTVTSPGEQVIRLTGTTTPTATDWFGLYVTYPGDQTDWALGAEASIDWLPGTTQAQKDALADLTLTTTINGLPAQMSLGKADVGTGWRRVFINSVKLDAGQEFNAEFTCSTSTQNWDAGGGGLEIRIRRPQLESHTSYKGFAYTTPAALPIDPGVTVNASGSSSRNLGFAQVGHGHANGEQGDSPLRVDTSLDWGMFVQWQPSIDANEILPNDNEWQIINLDNHWDAPMAVHNEIHLDIDGGNSFPGENRMLAFLWNAEGLAHDWIVDTVDLNDHIRMGDVCRIAYWKTGDWHYSKLNVYRNGTLVISRLASKQLTVSSDCGFMKQLTLGIDHREVGYGQTHSANGVFQHVAVEDGTLDEAAVDAFMATGARPLTANSIINWDVSSGSDRVYVRPY